MAIENLKVTVELDRCQALILIREYVGIISECLSHMVPSEKLEARIIKVQQDTGTFLASQIEKQKLSKKDK